MNPTLYRELMIPRPFVVLGVELKPFSVGHKLLLQQIGSPYEDGKSCGPDDLMLAVAFCSTTFEYGCAELNSVNLGKRIKSWYKRLTDPDWPAASKLFGEYIAYHSRFYSFVQTQEPDQYTQSKTPLLHSVVATLMIEYGLSHSDAMNRCFGLAMCDYILACERKGGVAVRDAEEQAAAKQAAQDFHDKLKRGEVKI